MCRMPSVQTIMANSQRMMAGCAAPQTRENLQRLARRYETAYRRNRASARPSPATLLLGQLRTARAFYALARQAAS